MIARGALEQWLNDHLSKLAAGASLSVRTYKGDRGFSVTALAGGGYLLEEDGFAVQSQTFPDPRSLMKAAKTAARREFPRSTQLRTKV